MTNRAPTVPNWPISDSFRYRHQSLPDIAINLTNHNRVDTHFTDNFTGNCDDPPAYCQLSNNDAIPVV